MNGAGKSVAALLALALVAALGWVVTRASNVERSVAVPEPAADTEQEGDVSQPLMVDAAPEVSARELSPGPAASSDSPRAAAVIRADPERPALLEVLVLVRETGAPLPGGRVNLRAGEGATTARWLDGPEDESPSADEEGRARFALAAGTEYDLWVYDEEHGGSARRQLAPFEAGEQRTVRLELPTLPDIAFVGRVVADASGEPIAGARVRFQWTTRWTEANGSMRTRWTQDLETHTDEDGLFRGGAYSWRYPHGRVDAPGFGVALFQIDSGHERLDEPFVIRLDQEAVIQGHVLGSPDPAAHRVRVRIDGRRLIERHGPAFVGTGEPTLESDVRADGSWRIAAVPPGVDVALELVVGERVVQREPRPLKLEPGAELTHDWSLGSGAIVSGLARIVETGQPLGEHEIWMLPGSEWAHVFGPHAPPTLMARTDASGRFRFEDVTPGDWLIGPAPSRPFREPAEDGDVAPVSREIEISADDRFVEANLEVHVGLFIEGHVLDPDGAIVRGGNVFGHATEGNVWMNAQVQEGLFRLGPLVPGSYEVTASAREGFAGQSPAVIVEAGTPDVELRLAAGGNVEGRLVAAAGELVVGEVTLVPLDSVGAWTMTRTGRDGVFRFQGITPATYLILGASGTRAGLLEPITVEAFRAVADLEVQMLPAAHLAVQYTGSSERAWFSVFRAGVRLVSDGLAGDRPRDVLLPPGPYDVSLLALTEGGESATVRRAVVLTNGVPTTLTIGDED